MATPNWNLLSSENFIFRCYLTHSSILVLKMLLLGLYAIILRRKKQVIICSIHLLTIKSCNNLPSFLQVSINPMDFIARTLQIIPNDLDRVKRAHRNDLEYILPHLIIGLLFILTGPVPVVAKICFRLVTISRIIHTIVYAFYPVPQPARATCFFVAYFITIFMSINTFVAFF